MQYISYAQMKAAEDTQRAQDDAIFANACSIYADGITMCSCSQTINQWADIVRGNYKRVNCTPNFVPFEDEHLHTCAIWNSYQKPCFPTGIKPNTAPRGQPVFSYSFKRPNMHNPHAYPMPINGQN